VETSNRFDNEYVDAAVPHGIGSAAAARRDAQESTSAAAMPFAGMSRG
jgi:hypothetical protein